jgi:hypothetical protein
MANDAKVCEFCHAGAVASFHHLIPRTLHSNRWFKQRYTREQMSEGLNVCRQCHKMIHETIPEKLLGRSFNTREKLLSHTDLAKFVAWKQRRINS